MAHHTPNFVGVFLDDFFLNEGNAVAGITLDQIRDIQRQLKGPGKELDLYITLNVNQLNLPIVDYLKLIDVVSVWTWYTADLANLETNLTRLEKLAPEARILLGCYTTEFEAKRTPAWTALPVPAMQHQCEVGLRWLRDGRIDGICIYGNFLDFDWDAMRWAREWIQRVGETKL
jgi:hypothetical protein